MILIHKIGVAGCGLMGSGIAEVCARAELDVVVYEPDAAALATGRDRVEASLARATARGKITIDEQARVLKRVNYTTDLGGLSDRDLVVEAIVEEELAKTALFAALDRVVERPDAILASNTSSIPIMKIAAATSRPEQVIGIHFFNPVPVLPLVELVPSLLTSSTVEASAHRFVAERLGKTVIRSQDRAGFIVNALLVPYILAAIRMLDSGFATADDIDRGMVLGCAHPMGPLHLADLIGLDTVKAIAEAMYEEFKEPLYSPAHSCSGWWALACSAGRPGAASSNTRSPPGTHKNVGPQITRNGRDSRKYSALATIAVINGLCGAVLAFTWRSRPGKITFERATRGDLLVDVSDEQPGPGRRDLLVVSGRRPALLGTQRGLQCGLVGDVQLCDAVIGQLSAVSGGDEASALPPLEPGDFVDQRSVHVAVVRVEAVGIVRPRIEDNEFHGHSPAR